MIVPIRPAATVVLLRDAPGGLETLLLKRRQTLAFAAGHWVFPGGALEAADIAGYDDLCAAARVAAVRETQEEAGLLLAPAALDYISHWTTPPADGRRRRYATWFFVTTIPDRHSVTVDQGEIVEHRWARPTDVLAAHRQGVVDLMRPTRVTLTDMAHCRDAAEARAVLRGGAIGGALPRLCGGEQGPCVLFDDDAGYASGDLAAPGPRHRTWPVAGGWRYECSPGTAAVP